MARVEQEEEGDGGSLEDGGLRVGGDGVDMEEVDAGPGDGITVGGVLMLAWDWTLQRKRESA